MNLSLSMNLFVTYEIEKALAKAREFGYEYVELFDFLFNQKAFSTKHINSLLAKNDLKASSIATVSVELPLTNDFFAGPDEGKRKKAADNMKKAIVVARELDCDMVTTEMLGNVANVGVVDQQTCKDCFLRSVDEIMPVLEKEDVSISFEPHPGDFIENSDEAVDFLKKTGSPRVGYLWCASHSFVMGGEPVDMLRYTKDILNFVYFSDTHNVKRIMAPLLKREMGAHEHLIPGRGGDVDFEAMFRTLKEIDYDGFVCAQPFSYAMDKPEEAAKESKEFYDRMQDLTGFRGEKKETEKTCVQV